MAFPIAFVPRIVGIQVITALGGRKKLRGMIRIVGSVLIDYCVATAVATAHKGIELLASHFLFRSQ